MYCWSSIVQEFRKNSTPENPNGGIEYLLQKKKSLLGKLSQKQNEIQSFISPLFYINPTEKQASMIRILMPSWRTYIA